MGEVVEEVEEVELGDGGSGGGGELQHLSSGVSLNLSWSSLSSPILPSPKDQVVARPCQV